MIRNKREFSNDSAVTIIPLGGVEEIGINCTVIEYQGKIFVIDMGLGFPEGDMYGIDFMIPNIDYLKKNLSRIQGLFITHGHLDHIGGLPYVLKDLNWPTVYGSRFTLEVIKNNMSKHEMEREPNLKVVDSKSDLVFGNVHVSFFRVNHSIPESLGIIIKTPEGNIVHTGDFKFDNSPTMEPVAEYDKIADIGSQGVLALLSDSTNSFKSGHSASEAHIMDTLQDIIEGSKGRILIATFSSLVFRVIQLIEVARRTNRKVAIAGRSMVKMLEIAQRMGYLGDLSKVFIDTRQIKTMPANKVMVIATGAQGEEMAALSRIIRGEHQDIAIQKGDTVILSASVIPGNDVFVQELVDQLSIQGAIVYHRADEMDLHTSGHGHQEDQKLMLNLTKPKFFIPVHGFQSFLYKHAQTAASVGIPESNIFIPRRGEILNVTRRGVSRVLKTIKTNPILISGSGVGDIGEIVMKERQQLGNNGVIIYSATVSKQEHKLVENPILITKGFTYFRDNSQLFDNLTGVGKTLMETALAEGTPSKDTKNLIASRFQKIVLKEMEREPMILVIINEV